MEASSIRIPLNDEYETSLKLLVVLSKAYKAINEQAEKDMRQYGLSPSEFMILELLFSKGRVPLRQIGEKISVTSGSITYNMDKLEKKRLLRRVPSTEDRRVIYAELTDEGHAFFGDIFPRHAARIDSLTAAATPEEKSEAIRFLKKLGKGAKGE